MSPDVDYYELLGVTRDADGAALKKGYRAASLRAHPDTGGTEGMFRLVQQAYQTLTDPRERELYDARLSHAGDGQTSDAEPAGDGHTAPAGSRDPGPGFGPRVEISKLRWPRSVDPDADVVVTPAVPAWAARVTPALAGLTGAVGLTLVVVAVLDHSPVAAAGAASALGAGLVGPRTRQPLLWPGVLGGMLCASVVLPAVFAPWTAAMLVLLGCSATGWLWSLAAPRILRTDLDQVITIENARSAVSFGDRGVSAHNPRGEASGMAARVGADAVAHLTYIPGVRVFHRVAAPVRGHIASRFLHAADQVAVCGRRAAVFVNVLSGPGTYSWDPSGYLLHDGRHFPGGVVCDAVRDQAWTDTGLWVRAFVLVTSLEGNVMVDDTNHPDGVTAGSAQEVIESAGAWLAQGDAALVDRDVLALLGSGLLLDDAPGVRTTTRSSVRKRGTKKETRR